VAGCEEDGFNQTSLLFEWPKSSQKALANFKLASNMSGSVFSLARTVKFA
jgi:hypothetical protein